MSLAAPPMNISDFSDMKTPLPDNFAVIPVHRTSYTEDYMLNPSGSCPYYENKVKMSRKS